MVHGLDFVAVYAVDGDHQDHWLNRLDVLVVVLLNDLDPLLMIPVTIYKIKQNKNLLNK